MSKRLVSVEEFVKISLKQFDNTPIQLSDYEKKRFLELAGYYAESNFPYGEGLEHLFAFIYEKDEELYSRLEELFA